MKALSKETIDLEIFKMGLHGLGKTVNNRHAYLSLAVSSRSLFSLVVSYSDVVSLKFKVGN